VVQFNPTRDTNRTRHLDKYRFKIEPWIKKEISDFGKPEYPSQIRPLEEIIIDEPRKIVIGRQKELGDRLAMFNLLPRHDLYLIKSAFASLPLLSQAHNNEERRELIEFWKGLLDYEIKMIHEMLDEEDETDKTPDVWDNWILRRIALLVLELRETEKPNDFWIPILEFGPGASGLVESFFENLFEIALTHRKNYPYFVNLWKAMIAYCCDSPKWKYSSDASFRDLNKIWCALMGLDYIMINLWDVECRNLVASMYDDYKKWALDHLQFNDCSEVFISFLKQPSAEDLFTDGLVWLDNGINNMNKYSWDRVEFQNKLTSFLGYCWENKKNLIKSNKVAFAAMRNLTTKLATAQNPEAMELIDRIVKD